jgi:hypothetical protein
MFLLVSVPYLVIIFYNQVEYSNLKKQVAFQESVHKAERLVEHANFVTRQNSMFFDTKLQMYHLNKKYREDILHRLIKATETVQSYTQAYNKAYDSMNYDRINALQSNISKKIDQLESVIEQAKWIFETNNNDMELKFSIQKGIHAIVEARISF